MNAYSAVNGPRPDDISTVESLGRSITAHVALAREAALNGDTEGERIYHEAINKLLTIREQASAGGPTTKQ
ncbi:hypothetical protein ACFYOY_13090 [Streptomyces sp. NPDC007875]|uniref:hypothetical protein n=1 Tax=Streptomyces sp. NPDC007875 TaxID=3364783 RepID=UPI003691B839